MKHESNKRSSAKVAIRLRSGIVRVEVKQAIVIVGVIVAADIERAPAGVRVDAPAKPLTHRADSPLRLIIQPQNRNIGFP